jgi:RNA polymerase sigma factor (sigma-70 family)
MDQRLVAAIQLGDDVGSAPLCAYLRPSIEKALRRVLKHTTADFEDLVQQTFERIVRTIVEGRFHARCGLRTWAHAIAVRVALDASRRLAVEARYMNSLSVDASHSVGSTATERRLEARDNLRLVGGVLSRMSPTHASATYLRHALEHPMDEVAHRLGVSTSAASSQLRRARLELKRRLDLQAVGL